MRKIGHGEDLTKFLSCVRVSAVSCGKMCLKNRAKSYLNQISGHRYTLDMAHKVAVATTYDPLRVLKLFSCFPRLRRSLSCDHLRPIEGTETAFSHSASASRHVATTYDPLRVLKPDRRADRARGGVATTYDPLRVLKHFRHVYARRVARCNHLRPIEGTETPTTRSCRSAGGQVATTNDPLRVLKQSSKELSNGRGDRCNHLRPIEGTETGSKSLRPR